MSKVQRGIVQAVIARVGNFILMVYFFVMMAVFPFYFRNGYQEIGYHKYFFFSRISLVMVGSMLLVVLAGFFLQRKQVSIAEHYRRLSVTDWFTYGYLAAVLLSYLFTDYKNEAFWGAEGWYMGLVSQLLFIGIYFLFSRYFKWSEKLLYLMLFSSGLVFLLGILNRYSVYPITMYGQQPGFISTLGNINWFCGYWSVFCPLGIMWYWNGKRGWRQAAAGIYTVLAFLSGVTQGSSSAYLVLAGIFILLFGLSFQQNQRVYRLLELCIMFAFSCQLARVFRYLPIFTMNYEDSLAHVFTDTNLTLYFGLMAGVIYLVFHYLVKQKKFDIAEYGKLRKVVLIFFLAVLGGYLILLIGNTRLPGGVPGLSGLSFFTFNENWGNSRGATWFSGLSAYQSMTILQKLVGVGSDCFTEYIYGIPELAARVYAQFGNSRLTNAHNEWITILVNQGILGLICYVGIFLSAIVKFLKNAQMQPVLFLCAVSVFSYTLHNMVSFQQVLNAPFVFMVLGIGEGVLQTVQVTSSCSKDENKL